MDRQVSSHKQPTQVIPPPGDAPPNEQSLIHPTAIVEPGAQLGLRVKIGPYSHIGSQVKIHDDVEIHNNVVIQGKTTIGSHCRIFSSATLGAVPQDLKYQGEQGEFICGSHNTFREYTNISIGTLGGGMKTEIGSNNLLMMGVHVAHDCIVGNRCIFANNVSLAGHVHVGDRVVFGGHVGCHQHVRIGSLAMLGVGSVIVQDVVPFVTAHGNHSKVVGLNNLGLRRANITRSEVQTIKEAYRLFFRSNLGVDEALSQINNLDQTTVLKTFTDFLNEPSNRGYCR